MTDSEKIRIIDDYPKLKKKWNKLSRQGKIQVLNGMEIATDLQWLLGLIAEAGEDLED